MKCSGCSREGEITMSWVGRGRWKSREALWRWWYWEGKEGGPDNSDLLNISSQLAYVTILKGNTNILILCAERGRQREGGKSTD